MVIRQDGTVTINNEARAQTALPLRPPWHRSTKKAPPEIVERIILAKRVSELLRTAAFAHLSGRNIDDDGAHFFCQRDKIGQLAGRPSVRTPALSHHGSAWSQPVEAAADAKPHDEGNQSHQNSSLVAHAPSPDALQVHGILLSPFHRLDIFHAQIEKNVFH